MKQRPCRSQQNNWAALVKTIIIKQTNYLSALDMDEN